MIHASDDNYMKIKVESLKSKDINQFDNNHNSKTVMICQGNIFLETSISTKINKTHNKLNTSRLNKDINTFVSIVEGGIKRGK